MLVHRRARRQGLGSALLRAAEDLGRDCGKSLLVLDTASSDALRLYARLGWRQVGVIPGYALRCRTEGCATPTISTARFSSRSRPELPVAQESRRIPRHPRGHHHAAVRNRQRQLRLGA